jgi:hypothetical protein
VRKFIVVRNGNQIIGRFDTGLAARSAAKADIQKHPRASYELGMLTKKFYNQVTPPQYTEVEEDIT